jgi:outer membrane protein assembly factor BamE (lipoprotein component of BamABCDE complex)
MRVAFLSVVSLVGLLAVSGCHTARNEETEKITVANVQRSLREGMADSAVVAALGAPNLITHGEDGGEVWVYDRIYAQARDSSKGSGFSLILFGSTRESSSSTNESRALTVMIYFDSTMHVTRFTYRSASF